MKKSEEYLDKANKPFESSITMEDVYVNREAALRAIKKAQIDAINSAIIECENIGLVGLHDVASKLIKEL
jgi:hypothetical protein